MKLRRMKAQNDNYLTVAFSIFQVSTFYTISLDNIQCAFLISPI
jgi:hypothetical protein